MKAICSLVLGCLATIVAHAQSPCNNKDFENQNLNGWTGSTGTNVQFNYTQTGGIINSGNNAALNGSSRQTIITVSSLDPNCFDPQTNQLDGFMTSLAPGGGTASVRLGNSMVGAEAEQLRYTFAVSPYDTVFTYQVACVFQDPQHQLIDQPGLMVRFYDQNNANITSLNQLIIAGDTNFPFIVNPNYPMINYKRWSGYSVNLATYLGQNITVEFTNCDCSLGGHYGYSYIDVSCFGSAIANVWPGDADYDLNVNNVDLLSIGLANGATGPVRPSASPNWVAQPCPDWNQNFSLGANYKHCDTDGNGVVNANDTLAVSVNYSNTHPFRYEPPVNPAALPLLKVNCIPTVVGLNTLVNADIELGTTILPIDSIYGICFTLSYPDSLIEPNNLGFTFQNSWMGTQGVNMMTFQKNMFNAGFTDVAITGTDQENRLGGYGTIGTLRFRTPTSATSGGNIYMVLSNVYAIMSDRRVVSLNTQNDLVTFSITYQGVVEQDFTSYFNLYPNPSDGQFQLNVLNGAAEQLWILDMTGKEVLSMKLTDQTNTIDAHSLVSGIYLVKILHEDGIFYQKIRIAGN